MKILITTIKEREVEIPKTSDLGILIETFEKLKIPFRLEHQFDMEEDFGIRFEFEDYYKSKRAFYFTMKFKLQPPDEESDED